MILEKQFWNPHSLVVLEEGKPCDAKCVENQSRQISF